MSSREGSGVGILLIYHVDEIVTMMYKLEFEATNNISEYEALVLGLRGYKDMNIRELAVFRDSKLIVQ